MKQYRGSSLVVALMVLSGILLFIFTNKDNLIRQERLTQSYYQNYLQNKLKIVELSDKNKLDEHCQKSKIEKGMIKLEKLNYFFACHSLFLNLREVRKKYIQTDDLSKLIHLEVAKKDLYHINTLAELPESSLADPKIVITNNKINERLARDFFGIIITDYPFNITGRRIYGTLYSNYHNSDRNLTYKKEVIENLQNKYWHYQPYSRNLLGDD
ncbi:hypothetical protein B0187_08620 [Haemophilus paracuniculus]|uniref:DUF2572 domain-containing protein n=1 Tax=Haemophilus paracuniculus TaxID=734 RepID=A0A1T0AQC6_9PAST|nr:DUF2572 family protein [Haemophilus paracuniculus]OOR98325.1 hypothetical protein B0187_08620 [Haemophilus paracuniculus]